MKEIESVETTGVVNLTALESIERAAIDIQIATAHQYPRVLSSFKTRAIEFATFDEETAEACIYRRPVGEDEQGKQTMAEGLSIRMAEIVACCYGNLRVGAIIIEQTPTFVKCRGMAHDLESNLATTTDIIESTVKKSGKPYSDRMRVVVAKAALSKARRDAIFQVVPRGLCKPIESAVRKVLFGEGMTLNKRREGAIKWVSKLGVEINRVWKALDISSVEELGVIQLEQLIGIKTAIQDGEITIDEAFPPLAPPKPIGGFEKPKSMQPLNILPNEEPQPPSPPAAQPNKLYDDLVDSLGEQKPTSETINEIAAKIKAAGDLDELTQITLKLSDDELRAVAEFIRVKRKNLMTNLGATS